MNVFQIILLLSWCAFLFYWAINWRNVKPTKFKGKNYTYFRFIGMVAIIFIVLSSRILHLNPPCQITWTGCHIHSQLLTSIPYISAFGAIFSAVGVIVAIIARRTLSTNWSSTLDLKKGHVLITQGIYSYVRHPIYLGILLMMIGTILVFPVGPEVFILVIVLTVTIFRIKAEEDLMTRTFPKEFNLYKKRTKYLIPFIF